MQIEPTYRPIEFYSTSLNPIERLFEVTNTSAANIAIPKPMYKLVQDYTLEGLEAKVNLLLADGWMLHGSLATTAEGKYRDRAKYTQAMIKNVSGSF